MAIPQYVTLAPPPQLCELKEKQDAQTITISELYRLKELLTRFIQDDRANRTMFATPQRT